MPDYYVYLKTGKHSGNDGATINTIPLRATSVSVSTSKTIPSMQVPLSGLVTGESETVALDIGMAGKSISISGFIVDGALTRHGSTVNMTSQEIAQLIHSSVDSTGVAQNQAIVELVFLIESKVDRSYNEVTKRNIPFTYHARGGNNLLDNLNVPFRTEFPDAETDDGLKGFIRQFSTTFTSDTVEVDFSLEFEVARILP
jgi:hypothetical protein